MKKTYSFLLIAFMITTLFACKKDKGEQADPNDIKDTWELVETSSSWFPVKTYLPGNGNLLQINGNTYVYYKDGQAIEQGNYSTAADTSVEENVCLINLKDTYKTRFDITNVTPMPTIMVFKTFFYIENDKLYMISGCYAVDGGSKRVYQRSHAITID